VFVVVELRARSPMLPLQLFRIRNFSGANLLTLLLYAALGGGLYFFPLNLIQVQGYTATAAGAALLPFILIMFVLSRWAGTLVDRFGSKLPLVVGPVTAAAGFALFALPGVEANYWIAFFPAVVVLGIGMTITVAPLTTTVMNSVGPDVAGIASGVNNAVSRTAALLAIAIFGIVMAWAFETGLHERLREAGVSQEISAFLNGQRGRLVGAALPPGVDATVASALRRTVQLSFVSGFRWIMLLSAGLALLSALAAWVLVERRPHAKK
jgi:predicted MFS family arabinose efflux permease